MAKKAAKKAKKTESKKVVKEVVEKKEVVEDMVKVLRFNPKDGERYPLEVKASEVLQDVDGDKGMKDIVL